MTKYILASFIFLFCTTSKAQNFGIAVKDHPYFKIIEWKGKGGMLMSRSPKEILNQINLTMISEKEEGMWEQKFNPKVRDPFYLFNEGTRHVYFLNNLDLVDNGRVSFNQINQAGNVKSKVLDVGIKVKRLEGSHDYNKFELIDAAVTDRTLTYLYRYYHKKEKVYYDFLMLMTHHNLQHMVIPLGDIDRDDISSNKNGQWQYSGFEGDKVFITLKDLKTDVPGWMVKGFSAKGVMEEDHFFFEPDNMRSFKNIGYGNVGKYYLENEDRFSVESGLISFINGHFYLVGLQETNGQNNLSLFKLIEDDQWDLLNSVPVGDINEKEDVQLGSFPINEGVTYRYKHDGSDKVGILLFEKGKEGDQEDFSEDIVYNPSRLILDNGADEFVTSVPGKILVCKLTQFKASGGISFQHK